MIGPAAILVAVSMGPGTISSCILGGSSEGYNLLWIVAASGFLGAAVALLGGRVYAVTKKAPVEIVKDTVTKWVGYPFFLLSGLAVYYVIIIEGNLLGHTTELMFPGFEAVNATIVVPLLILAIAVIFTFGFKRVVFFCSLFTAVMAFVFFTNLFFIDISWGEFFGGLVPSVPKEKLGFLSLAGILGGAAGGMVIIGYSYIVKNKGWDKPEFITNMNWDQIFFYGILFGIFSVGIYLSGATVLHKEGITVRGATDAAIALKPLVGPLSLWVFLVGLFTAVATTIGALATLLCYFLADLVGIPPDLDNKKFKVLLFVSIMLAVIGPFVGGLPAMQHMALAMVVMLLAGVFFFAVYLYVGNSKKIMGKYKNGWLFNIVLFTLFFINLFFGLMAVLKMVKG